MNVQVRFAISTINCMCFFSHPNVYRIKHKLALTPGHWHVRVKSKNAEGWSAYSTSEDIHIESNYRKKIRHYHHHSNAKMSSFLFLPIISGAETGSASAIVSSLCAISLAALTSIYSINFSTRLFG